MKILLSEMSRVTVTVVASLAVLGGLQSCADRAEGVEINRLDRQISYGEMPDDSVAINATETLFQVSGYPHATALTVADYSEKPSIREHLEGVEREFDDMGRESKALGEVFGRMRDLLPQVREPRVFTIISPFAQSIIVADTTLYIGLNHYLGVDYKYYEYFPDYVRVLKVRPRIPVDVAEALVRTTYPFSPDGEYPQTVACMAYEGAVAEAVMQLTGRDEAEVLGYDAEKYGWLRDNEKELWQTIVGKQMLFSTDHAVARSLLDPAPLTSVISPDAPGRAGRYIGHRLMEAYMKNNPSVALEELLSPAVYNSPSLLTSAKYNP